MFLTQIIDGQATELALCEKCARDKGLFDPQSLTFAEKFFPEEFRKRVDQLIQQLSREDADDANPVPVSLPDADLLTQCPSCRFTLQDFRNTGRLGCPDCYRAFAREWHAEAPAEDGETDVAETEDSVALGRRLQQKLDEAVAREDYEEAARLRDRIRQLD